MRGKQPHDARAMRIWLDLLRRFRDPRGQPGGQGWAGHSLAGSISRSLIVSVATLQGVTALAALRSLGLEGLGSVIAATHITAIGAAITVLRTGRGHLWLILGSWGLFLVDWTVSPAPDSTLLFAACWICNLTAALPAFLLRGPVSWLAPLGAAATIPILMVIARPELATHPLVTGVFVTTIAITVATRIGLSYIVDYTRGVDTEARALEETTASLATRKSATLQAAEDARILHDTAINTLGAIANGGTAIDDRHAVRQRCLADIAAMEALRSTAGDTAAVRHGFRDAIRPNGIRVRHAGVSDEEIADIESSLPLQVMRAFSRATAEAVQNAAKHSGADEVVVSVERTAGGVRVIVSDQGTGIRHPQRHGLGVERSILERTREVGIRAAIDSAPGLGTVVTLEYEPGDAAIDQTRRVEAGGSNVEAMVLQLRSRSAFALSAGMVAVGVILAALNHPGEATPEWLMVAVIALACALAWRERHRPRLSVPTTIALITSGPVAFVLSAWSVGFGHNDPVLWQAIAPTGPLLALMIVALPQAVKVLSFLAYLLTALAVAALLAPTSEATSITLVAAFLGLGLIAGVTSFVRTLATVAGRSHREQQQAFAAGLQLAAVEAAAETRQRWREAGLDQSISLLRDIGAGQADPGDPSIRRRCAEEEAFLRQLSLLSPELIQMGAWFARALNISRLKGVNLTLRAGAADATTGDAPRFGQTLLTTIDAMPQGANLTAAFFATAKGLTMTLVAPTPHLRTALNTGELQTSGLRLQTFGAQDLAELTMAGSGS